MEKLDLTKKHRNYYRATQQPEIVEIEPAQFLSVEGVGDPSGDPFAENLQALYSTAYAIKFMFKAQGKDFVVSKLEGLWWFDESKYSGLSITDSAAKVPRSEWEYRLLIRLPDYVSEPDVQKGVEMAVTKKKLPSARKVGFYEMQEGKCVQMLHLGPFDTEPESLEKIGSFMKSKALTRNGVHHEIYLSDPRKTAPEKLKTILREPVQKIAETAK